jgi:hypothetical protein
MTVGSDVAAMTVDVDGSSGERVGRMRVGITADGVAVGGTGVTCSGVAVGVGCGVGVVVRFGSGV